MKPAVKIVPRSQAPRRRARVFSEPPAAGGKVKRVRVPLSQRGSEMDLRTRALVAGALAGAVLVGVLLSLGMTDERTFLTGLLFTAAGPVYLTVTRLKTYAPLAYGVRHRELWNVPIGIFLGAVVFYVWQPFPSLYLALPRLIWIETDLSGGVYVEAIKIAFTTISSYLLGLFLGSILVSVQVALWLAPAYWAARLVSNPVEAQIEKLHQQRVRQSSRKVVGRRASVAKLGAGAKLTDAKLQLRAYGTMLSLAAGLVTMTVIAWGTPFF